MAELQQSSDTGPWVHPAALCESDAVGAGTRVWAFAHVVAGATEIEISFTDAHLARGIGDAIHHAYEGDIDYQYTKEDIMLRVTWAR